MVTGVNFILRSTFLTYLLIVAWYKEYLKKRQDFITFYRNHLHYGMALHRRSQRGA